MPSIGLVEVKPSTIYAGVDLFIAATQATQVYFLPYLLGILPLGVNRPGEAGLTS